MSFILGSQWGLGYLNEWVIGFSAVANNQLLRALLRRPDSVMMTVIVALILGPIAEEVLFRKWLLNQLLMATSIGVRVGISSTIFACLHGWNSPIIWLSYFVSGALLSQLALKTHQLRWPILAHITVNCLAIL